MWHTLAEADRALGSHVAAAITSPALQTMFVWLSTIGRGGMVWLAFGLVTWFVAPTKQRPVKRRAVWRLVLSIGLSALLVDGMIKPIINRARPFTDRPDAIVLDIRPDTASFPSGHASNAAAGATALARIWPAATIPLWTLAILVALSRVIVGVHFPADVIGGLIIGYAVARLVCARAPQDDAIAPARAAPTQPATARG